jgi:hypothetical protein
MTRILTIVTISLLLISCGTSSSRTDESNENDRLVGKWLLISKVQEGKQVTVNEHQILFEFKQDGTFVSRYRYRPADEWLNAGAGAFIFNPPLLELFWNSGRVVALTVVEKQPDTLSFHHGRNMAPTPGQEPEQVFKRVSEP